MHSSNPIASDWPPAAITTSRGRAETLPILNYHAIGNTFDDAEVALMVMLSGMIGSSCVALSEEGVRHDDQ